MRYPFLVQCRGREIILVTAETDGKCSPVISGVNEDAFTYTSRNFAKDGFNENYRLYHGEIKVEYKCPPFPFLVKSRCTNNVYFVNEYTNGKCSPALNHDGNTNHDFTKGMGDFELYQDEFVVDRRLILLYNGDILLDYGQCALVLAHRCDHELSNTNYSLSDVGHNRLTSFDGKIKLKMDGDKLISTKIEEEIPEYPFIVEHPDGTLHFVSAATDGKCSPALDNSGRHLAHNFKKSGLGSFKIYNGTVTLKNRKGEENV